jgi:glucokinase
MSGEPYFVGTDVGGTNVKMVAVTGAGVILERVQFPTDDSELAVWAQRIGTRLDQWKSSLGEWSGIGIASPGLVRSDHRAIAWMEGRMASVCDFDWTDYLESSQPIPVLNDAHAALVGESWLGAAKGARNVLLLTLGTGVGGAAMVDGKLLKGAIGRAGHFGHISLDPNGTPDIVGTPGSLEDLVGDATLVKRSGGAFYGTKALVAAVRNGDARAKEIWTASIHALAVGLVSLINVLDPELVVLGGGIAEAGVDLLAPLSSVMESIEWRPFGTGVPIVTAGLAERAGALGAARFAMTHRKENS